MDIFLAAVVSTVLGALIFFAGLWFGFNVGKSQDLIVKRGSRSSLPYPGKSRG